MLKIKCPKTWKKQQLYYLLGLNGLWLQSWRTFGRACMSPTTLTLDWNRSTYFGMTLNISSLLAPRSFRRVEMFVKYFSPAIGIFNKESSWFFICLRTELTWDLLDERTNLNRWNYFVSPAKHNHFKMQN